MIQSTHARDRSALIRHHLLGCLRELGLLQFDSIDRVEFWVEARWGFA
jgi:uncharacterized protein YcaQ